MEANITQESLVCRGFVQALRTTKKGATIHSGGMVLTLPHDDKLNYEIALAVQSYYRRNGVDNKLLPR